MCTVAEKEISQDAATRRRIELYREGVEKFFELNTDDVISNGKPEHAAVLYEMFFKHAKACMRILCENLDEDVFCLPSVIEAAKKALSRNVCIRVLINDKVASGNKFVQELKNKELFRIKELTTEPANSLPNFAVMDKKGFRWEPNPEECKAIATVNNPELALKLVDTFDRLYGGC